MIKNIIVSEQMDNLKKGIAVTSSLFNRAKQVIIFNSINSIEKFFIY